jgi:hypothetical protein
MSKFIKMEAGDEYAELIKKVATELSLSRYVDIQPRYLAKPLKNNVGGVWKWNDVSATLTDKDNTIVVGIYGEAFDRVDEETREFWVRSLLNQIEYDFDKDKICINKDLITMPLSIYQQYGNIAMQKKELEIHTINMLIEEEKERKAAEKEAKKAAKKNKR